MQIQTTARHFELTPGLRQHVEERLDRIGRYLDRDPEISVVLAVEKHRHQAEISLKGDGLDFVARAVSEDMYSSVDQAVDKLVRQVKRHNERRRTQRKPARIGRRARIHLFHPLGAPAGEMGAVPAPDTTEHQEVRLLGLRQALAEVDSQARDCLVFIESGSGLLHILYRRPDGSLVLVETDAEVPQEDEIEDVGS
jgi:putative sigma-54 modulation protein